jgi:Sec-independent protein translocase protein TatA
MAVGGVEWILVGAVAIVILVWGPNTIPKIARTIAQARREFELAQKELINPEPLTTKPSPMSDEDLILKARSLGIMTLGKTREDLTAELSKKAITTGPRLLPLTPAGVSGPRVPPAVPGTGPSTSQPAAAGGLGEGLKLADVARGLGLEFEGKTDAQLKEEIKRALA